MVAAAVASPGTANSTEVMSPVVAVTDIIPRRKAKAPTGVMLKMKGSIKANVVAPPMPGKMPTQNPTAIPISISPKVGQVKTASKPEISASNTVAPIRP